jgi:hypothetical protein
MRPVTRARSLDRDGNAFGQRGVAERDNIPLPRLLVEIRREKPACLVRQHGIDASGEIERVSGCFPGKMGANDVVTERNECLIWALTAFDLRLSADSSDPLISTDGRVTRFSAFRILPSTRKYLLPPAEQAAEERNLLCGW